MLSNASLIFTRFSLPVLDDFTDKDMRNIERIYKNVLVTTKSREQQKALVKKYLEWVSRLPKKKGELSFFCLFVSMSFQATSEKIRELGTWRRRCKSRPDSDEIRLFLEQRLLNNTVRSF